MKIDNLNQKIVTAKIIKIFPTYVLAKFDDKIGICHIKDISDYHVKSIKDFFTIDKEYHFLLKNSDDQKYHLSYKAINPKLLKNHRQIIPTYFGFNNLKKMVDELLNK